MDGAVDLQLDDLVHVVSDFGEHLVGVLPVSGRAPVELFPVLNGNIPTTRQIYQAIKAYPDVASGGAA